ncbi:MAG: 16S rRNA (cytosine(1402)-N(4))-methyltransferase RsmH [Nitrospirota bacterium]
MEVVHVPVMQEEVLEALKIKDNGVYIDATVGLGGHSKNILNHAGGCTLIGIDRDDKALEIAKERLTGFENVHFVRESFSNIKSVAEDLGYDRVNGILLDIGVSMLHLKSEDRGFSFLSDDFLDMRMDSRQDLTAEKIVNRYREKELADIIWRYGDERFSRRIAKAIVYTRQKKPVKSCKELAGIIERAVRRRGRIHPATRTFQALRIEVNKELDELTAVIDAAPDILAREGRLCVISYHSLEDRIVKNSFKALAKEGLFKIITKKPLVPGRQEQITNPSSRSAKMRVGEKI